jgi:hypothetical protein
MSAEIINFRRARKAKARSARATTATENRIVFGRTRSEREKADALRDKAARTIEAHRREDDGDDGGKQGP